MEQAWRVYFTRFLKEHGAATAGKARNHVHWVGRWLASGGSDSGALTPAAFARFTTELGRTEEPGTVRQAEEAIQLYGFFQARHCQAPRSCMRLVIDANAIIARLLRDGVTRKLLMEAPIAFESPEWMLGKIRRHRRSIASRAGLSHNEFDLLLALLT